MTFFLLAWVALAEETCPAGGCGEIDKGQRKYYNEASHYDTLWGKDNLGFGYHAEILGDAFAVRQNFSQGAEILSLRLLQLGKVDHNSKVLDLGSGKGGTCRLVAKRTGAACTGLDLSEGNVARALEGAKAHPELRLDYKVGSFTDLPKEILEGGFTHVISKVAFCHVHDMLPAIFGEVKKLVDRGAKAVINDYLGGENEPSARVIEHVYTRLHFSKLHGHTAWRQMADKAGLVLQHYENLDAHITHGYKLLAETAGRYNFKSEDGASLEENYRHTVAVAEAGEIGMNLAIFTGK